VIKYNFLPITAVTIGFKLTFELVGRPWDNPFFMAGHPR